MARETHAAADAAPVNPRRAARRRTARRAPAAIAARSSAVGLKRTARPRGVSGLASTFNGRERGPAPGLPHRGVHLPPLAGREALDGDLLEEAVDDGVGGDLVRLGVE